MKKYKVTIYGYGAEVTIGSVDEEQKAIIRATKEKNKEMLTCEICNKTMRASHYKIYKHGHACQQRP